MSELFDLKYRGHDFASVRLADMRGEEALGYYRLIVSFQFIISPQEPDPVSQRYPSIRRYFGRVKVSGVGRSDQQHLLGTLVSVDAWNKLDSFETLQKATKELAIGLTPGMLEAVEDLRQGEQMTFHIDFIAYIDGEVGLQPAKVTIRENVTQSAWTTVLETMNYRKTVFFEVPVPDADRNPKLAEAYKHFQSAQDQMRNGKWRKAVEDCRSILEQLSMAVGDKDAKDPEVQALFERVKKMDLPARYRTLRRALKIIADAAHHDDEYTASIEWERADAMAMVSMMAILLQRFIEPPH